MEYRDYWRLFGSLTELTEWEQEDTGQPAFGTILGNDYPTTKRVYWYWWDWRNYDTVDGFDVVAPKSPIPDYGRWKRIPTENAADWNAMSGLGQILNKPSIPTKVVVSAPSAKTRVIGTAYQATDPTKVARISIDIDSSAAASLTGTVTNTAVVRVGPTSASVATAPYTGSEIIGRHKNAQTAALVVGLSITQSISNNISFDLPIGYYYSIITTAGTVSVAGVQEQVLTVSA